MNTDADIATLKAEMAEYRRRTEVLESEVRRLEAAERAKWQAGVYALGTVIVSLVGVIWAYRAAIFTGKQ